MSRREPLYRPLDWVMVRAPLRPVEAYLALAGDHERPTGTGPDDPRVRRALAVGGGDLARALTRPPTSDRARRRLEQKLQRYLIRMSTRPTPYGLFAGVGLGAWSDRTDLTIADAEPALRTRPDMGWLVSLVAELERHPDVRAGLRWFANPTTVVRDGRVFLSEPASLEETEDRPVSLRATAPVLRALELTRTPIPYRRLVEELTRDSGASRSKVERLLEQLWKHTVLLTDLRPPLTTDSPARYVADRLATIPAARARAESLSGLLTAMADWDGQDPERGAAAYSDLVALADAVHPIEAGQVPVQSDMALSLAGYRVNRAVAEEAARAAELLLRLSPMPYGLSSLEAYRHAFEARYGAGRDVPILTLLDPETGLGPPGHAHGGKPVKDRSRLLRNLALEAIRDGRQVVELDEATLLELETWPVSTAEAPASLDVSVFVVARSARDVDEGDFHLMVGPNLGAPAAGRNLGRFADLLGPSGREALEEAAAAEAAVRPDRLSAEVVYLPRRRRSANVAIRPLVRDREIVLGTVPGSSRTIPLDELVVGLHDGRFVVTWPALDVEVTPCSGNMLTTWQAPPAVRLLDALARDTHPQFSTFPWGELTDFPFLPRIQAGRVILSPATWRIGTEVTPETLADWRERWQVPRYVYLTAGDNRLLLDLDDPAQADQLHTEIRKLPAEGRLTVQEGIPSPDHAWLPGPEGRHISEFVVPLALNAVQQTPKRRPSLSQTTWTAPSQAEQLLPPGSEWLYVKLYHSPDTDDQLIAGPVRDFCRDMCQNGTADRWFFLRYTDPQPHLRLRLHGDPRRLTTELLPDLCQWAHDLTSAGVCTRFSLDTYEREIERYGGPLAITWAEQIFSADSTAVAELLALKLDDGGLDRTLLAVRGVDEILAGLGLDEARRAAWCRDRFLNVQIPDQHETGKAYRRRAGDLRALLGGEEWLLGRPGGTQVLNVMTRLRRGVEQAAEHLARLDERGELRQPMHHLASSFVHMHCNRLFVLGQQEEHHIIGHLQRARTSLLHAPLRTQL